MEDHGAQPPSLPTDLSAPPLHLRLGISKPPWGARPIFLHECYHKSLGTRPRLAQSNPRPEAAVSGKVTLKQRP